MVLSLSIGGFWISAIPAGNHNFGLAGTSLKSGGEFTIPTPILHLNQNLIKINARQKHKIHKTDFIRLQYHRQKSGCFFMDSSYFCGLKNCNGQLNWDTALGTF